jgi:hypothetical protein
MESPIDPVGMVDDSSGCALLRGRTPPRAHCAHSHSWWRRNDRSDAEEYVALLSDWGRQRNPRADRLETDPLPNRAEPDLPARRPSRPTVRRTIGPLGRRWRLVVPPPQGDALGWANHAPSEQPPHCQKILSRPLLPFPVTGDVVGGRRVLDWQDGSRFLAYRREQAT